MNSNVLLMAVSTLRSDRTSGFTVDVNGLEISEINNCVSQMEPIMKLALLSHPDTNWKILMLCTEKTVTRTDNFAKKTSVASLKERIDIFMREHPEITAQIEYDETPIDEKNPISGIREVVGKIRKENPDLFWIDTHGGFREIALDMESIISVLRPYKIYPTYVLGVQFAENSEEKSKIVDQRNSYEMFDFVSGMNEFLEYGSVKILKQYYADRNKDEKTEKMLVAMEGISNGLKECDSDKYMAGIDNLREAMEIQNGRDELIPIFEECIRKDYGEILEKDRPITKVVKRCLDKGMIQQGLTLLESQMPKEMVERGIIYCDQEVLDGLRRNNIDIKNDLKFMPYQDIYNNLVNALCAKGDLFDRTKGEAKAIKSFVEGIGEERTIDKLCNNISSNLQKGKGIVLEYKKDAKNSEDTKEVIKILIKTEIDASEAPKLDELVHLHKAMKDCRNRLNHGDPTRPSMEAIIKACYRYVELADELFEKYERKTEYMLKFDMRCSGNNNKGKKHKGAGQYKKKEVETKACPLTQNMGEQLKDIKLHQ